MSLYNEIIEQPARLADLLASQRDTVLQIGREVKKRNIETVFLAARGTSDNAGRYLNYVFGAFNGLPVALAAASLFTYYQKPPRLRNALVIGISQSGQSPDIVEVITESKKQGNLTLTITNAIDSPLANAADLVLDVMAGPEKAVAATKSYTAELMAIAMLSSALSGDPVCWQELEKVGTWADETLKIEQVVKDSARLYAYMKHAVVLGRGYNYATAFEWALKLKEMAYVVAEPYSTADFQHGPIAMVSPGFPVFVVAPKGKVLDSMIPGLSRLKNELQARLLIISNDPSTLKLAETQIAIPDETPEWLSPLVSIIPAQLFAYHLTKAIGHDPDVPRTIQKVTETH